MLSIREREHKKWTVIERGNKMWITVAFYVLRCAFLKLSQGILNVEKNGNGLW